jgi:tRNA (guanine37-N1)-methyltransferase
MRFDVISLFPEMLALVRDHGVTGRAHAQGRWALQVWNPRDTTHDVHRRVDDRPYGGGPGMVMMADPLRASLERVHAARAQSTPPSQANGGVGPSKGFAPRADAPIILLSPAGRLFDQSAAQHMASGAGAVFICGRYEGVDQRFIDTHVDEEWSMGDFVLSGGEIAALAVIDAVVRLLPGVLNDDDSARFDSFHDAMSGLLDSPHYTRPEVFDGVAVPNVLLSGHHAKIAMWRREQSLRLTSVRRPDLIAAARAAGRLTAADERVLAAAKPLQPD